MINVIESFAARQPGGGALTVTRRATGSPAYANGYPAADGSPTTISIIAHVVPTGGRDLKILADQGITSESRTLRTSTKLIPRNATTEPDRVTGVDLDTDTDGGSWVVQNAAKHVAPDGDVFYVCVVTRDATQ
jgi:hypothetical protein